MRLFVVGSQVVKLNALGGAIANVARQGVEEGKARTNKKLRGLVVKHWGNVINITPLGIGDRRGRARGDWIVAEAVTGQKGTPNKKKNGERYVSRKLPKKLLGKKVFLFSSNPYINMLEFGGYIKNPKNGTYNPRTRRFEIRSANGFSRQAPKGMARINNFNLRVGIRKAFK